MSATLAVLDDRSVLAVEGGSFDLYGNNLTLASISSQANNTTGTIYNTIGGIRTLTVGSDNTSTSFSGQLGANLNFTKTGTGTLTLNQSNASYAGIITVSNGVLVTGNALCLLHQERPETLMLELPRVSRMYRYSGSIHM